MTRKDQNIAYYDANAKAYFDKTVKADMSNTRNRFLEYLEPGSKILDAGCGSGRDSRVFLDAGYSVKAFDASSELAALASGYTGRPVACMTFHDMKWENEFDGIWACSSLLHLNPADLRDALDRIYTALKPGGVFFTCFKYGNQVWSDDSRDFYNQTEGSLTELLSEDFNYKILDLFTTGDVMPGRSNLRWINIISSKED